MKWFRSFALVVMVGLLAAACSGDERATLVTPSTTSPPTTADDPSALAFADDDAAERPTLRISVPKVTFVAPHVVDETDPVQILVTDLLTDGLTELDPATGRARPALAEDWTVSADRLTWIFTLRPATFSTGEPIRAIDVATSLNRLAARGVESLSGPHLAVVDGYDAVASGEASAMAGVTVVDDTTLVLTLSQPYEPLPELLAGVTFGVFPVDIDTRGTLPLSSSVRFTPTVMWEEGFRMSAADTEDGLETLEVWIDPTGDLIEAGEVDVAFGLDPEDDFDAALQVTTVPRAASAYYAFNLNAVPFDDLLMRQAVLQSIDRPALRDAHFPHAEVMTGLVTESIAGGVDDSCAERCTLNGRAAARKIRRSDSDGTPFTVDFFVDGDDGDERRLAEDIVTALRDAGLNATARGDQVEEYGAMVASGELTMFRFGSVSSALVADAFLQSFVSTSPDNVTGTSLAEFDELILDARSTVDDDIRDARYAEAEAMLFENALILPLVEFTHRIVHTDTIESIGLEADGSLDLASIVFAP